MNNNLENELKELLKEKDYASFIRVITELPINIENYKSYLDKIELVLSYCMKTDECINPSANSGDVLLRVAKENLDFIQGKQKEESFQEMYPKLKDAIVSIFKIKLNMRNEVVFSDDNAGVLSYLENFKERFMR